MIALVDCNNFFASCEQVFSPHLRKIPLVILSNNDGCIVARSKEAKKIGIKMGSPIFHYKKEVTSGKIVALSSNFSLYGDMSKRVMQTLSSFSPDIEIYSIDEAFIYLDSLPNDPDLLSLGKRIRNRVLKWTGIPVSVGIAPTKTLAKVANEKAKREEKEAVFLDTPNKIDHHLTELKCEDIWGIGKKLSKRLYKQGIFTALQLKNAEDTLIKSLIHTPGLRTCYELRGKRAIDRQYTDEPKQSILYSRSFGKKTDSKTIVEQALSSFTARAASKLRRQNCLAGYMMVFVESNPFSKDSSYMNSTSIKIPYPTSFSPDLIQIAKTLLNKIFIPDIPYKKVGVLLGDFSTENQSSQLTLFSYRMPKEEEKRENLSIALDKINKKFPKKPLFFAAEGAKNEWQNIPLNRSKKITCDWNDLLEVKTDFSPLSKKVSFKKRSG